MNYPHPKRILVLDKDLKVRSKIALFLMGEGYEVELAANGIEALDLHRNNPLDIVIMELQLSSIDGFKVFFQLQSSAASPRFIIFAGLRSGRSHIYLRIARQLGAEATLYMPFTAEQLHAAVHNVLSESEEATFLSHALVGSPVG